MSANEPHRACPSVEGVEALHRAFLKSRDVEPATAVAAARALLELASSDPNGQLMRFVRRLTRGGQEVLELALERIESARTPEGRREAQQLFDDVLRLIAVP